MPHLYFALRRWTIALFLIGFTASQSIWAQINNTPFEQVFVATGIDKETLKSAFPNLYQVVKNKDYKTEDINSFIKSHGTEWDAFTNLPGIKKLNIAWGTLGLTTPEAKPQFQHSIYQWYKAAGITEAKRAELFPNFPLPNLKNDLNKELADYEQKIGAWQRLHPEEFERFLNTPELTALNPYYNGYYKLPYMPRFIGAKIGLDKPVKANTGNSIADEYNYQLKLRNWYFVFKPQEFNKLYGKDYKFPDSFDQQAYRGQVIKMLNDTKEGTYPNMSNPH
ncbi:MAG TPA: hypothetical protein VK154_04250 [Chitinophagales bacterium]|nr:hypothetical protein [Chitinophagales bacterium]